MARAGASGPKREKDGHREDLLSFDPRDAMKTELKMPVAKTKYVFNALQFHAKKMHGNEK